MNTIKQAIRESNKTQIEVAGMLGIRPDSLSTAITRDTLTVAQLKEIADFINVPLSDLFNNSGVMTCPHCHQPIKLNITKE